MFAKQKPKVEPELVESEPVESKALVPAKSKAVVIPASVKIDLPASAPSENKTQESTPVNFREALDKLDGLMSQEFDAILVAAARDIVKRTMIELREYPEYAGIVTDGDVRNVMIFLNRTVQTAKESVTIAADKKRKSTAKKNRVQIDANMASLPLNLDALGNFDASAVDDVFGFKK